MGRRFIVCIFALVAFSASAAHGVHGGHNGQSVRLAPTAATGSAAISIIPRSGRVPGGTDPAHVYLHGTSEPCNLGPDAEGLPLAFSSDRAALCPAAGKAEYPETQPPVRHAR